MLTTIIEKEIRDIVGSTKFAVTFGVVAVLIVATFFVGASNYEIDLAHYEASKAENLRQMDGMTDWLMIQEHRVFLPPQPLALLVSGISNDIGRTTEIKGQYEMNAHDSKYNEEPIYAAFRFLDLEFAFAVVLSLFAILLGYDAVCGEKENGTLRLSLANAVPRFKLILGKLLGSFIALTVALLIALTIGCLILIIMKIPLSGEEWLRLLLIIGTGLLYFGAFLTLAVFVSSLAHRSSSAFLMLLVVWIMAVMIVPRVSVLLAARAVDVPSVDDIAAQKGAFRKDIWAESREQMKNYKPSGEVDPDNIHSTFDEFQKFMQKQNDERNQKIEEQNNRLNEMRHNRQVVQQKLALDLARVSPVASMQLAASELAGTSLRLKDRYFQEATDYRDAYGRFMKEKTGFDPKGASMIIKVKEEGAPEPEPIDPNELPVFEFHGTDFASALKAALPDFGILTAFNLLFFIGAVFAFIRYDVR